MIPKVIHYCWFGGRPLPESAKRCIDSWRRFLPDYEIRRWDENNYDIDTTLYTRQAAGKGKWAFVSDYARFDILYRHGGLYFDTDVEIIAPMDDIVAAGPFMGWEKSPVGVGVAAGLGMGAEAGMEVYGDLLEHYRSIPYLGPDGNPLPGTVVKHVTDLLTSRGLQLTDTHQTVAGITVYPSPYFNPLDDATGRLTVTPETRSIHHYDKTWCDGYGPMRTRLSRLVHRWFGTGLFIKLRKLLPS